MTRPAPLLPHWVRDELAPLPGRVRAALAMSGGTVAALTAGLLVQFASFPAPLMAFKSLMPSVVCTWSLLALRLLAIWAGAAFAFVAVGIAVQLPWLLLPGFFVVLTVITYLVPIRQNPISGYCLALIIAGVTYSGVFAPHAIGATALTMAVGFSIGVTTATVLARLHALPPARDRLAAALAESFERTRARLGEAGARLRGGAPPLAADPPPLSALAAHLQLLGLVRMEHLDLVLERAFVALITAAERAATFVAIAEAAAPHRLPAPMAAHLDSELTALFDALDHGLARYAAAAHRPDDVLADARTTAASWPDYRALVEALRARERAPSAPGSQGIGLAESTRVQTLVQALEGLADVLHTPPEALEHVPAEPGQRPPRRLWPPFDPYAAQFAAKISFACVLALLIGVATQARSMETAVLNPLILAQGSYGATIRRAGLRIAGVVAGGVLAILTTIAVMPNTADVTAWLLIVFLVAFPCAYVALAGPALSYLGVQTAATYMIILIGNAPITDVHVALWRFLGTVVGAAVLLGVFQIVAPDYAGRQIVSRFTDLLRNLLAGGPEPGRPLLPVAAATRLTDQTTAGLADLLRLAGEARIEGAASGVDPDAAVNAAGILRRLVHRYALLRRSRRTAPRPPLPAETAAALLEVERAARGRLQRLVRVLDARHHRALTTSRRHRDACAAARELAAEPAAELGAAWAAFASRIDSARRELLPAWPQAAGEAMMAEVAHLQRIVELLPKLEAELVRAVLPEPGGVAQMVTTTLPKCAPLSR
ncbi:MAG: FUSC family protein [Candidatus Binatia bacterium]